MTDGPTCWAAHVSDSGLYFDDFELPGSSRWNWIISNTDFLWYCYTQFLEDHVLTGRYDEDIQEPYDFGAYLFLLLGIAGGVAFWGYLTDCFYGVDGILFHGYSVSKRCSCDTPPHRGTMICAECF